MTRLSRRRLLTSGVAASMLAATAFATQARPVRAGVLRLAVPVRGSEGVRSLVAATTVFNRLTATDADGGLRGELATGWEASSDAHDWLITLRGDVRFHDGTAMTAVDVAGALAQKADLLGGVQDVRADGPDRVRIQLTSGNPGLPFLLADPELIIAKDGVGTGAYRPEGTGLVPAQGYFDDRRPGWFERIEFVSVARPRDLVEAVQSGLADVAELCDPASTHSHRGRPAVSSIARPAALQITASGSEADALSQALKLGIDRTALLANWLGGHGAIASDHPAVFDPDAARALLRQAGMAQATLSLSDDLVQCPATARLLRALARDARRIGLALSMVDRNAAQQADLQVSQRTLRMTADATLAEHPRSGLDRVQDFEGRLTAARAAHSTAERQMLLDALDRDIAAHSTTVIPVFRDMTVIHTPRLDLSGETRARTGPNVAERWAFA